MKVKIIKEIIAGLDDDAEIYCGYTEDNSEQWFDMFNEQDIIDRANNQAGNDEKITDVNTALSYLYYNDTSYNILT